MRIRLIISAIFVFFIFGEIKAFDPHDPNIHCEKDTVKINNYINELKKSGGNLGERISKAAKFFIGVPEDNYYQTNKKARLRINVDSLTSLGLINNAIALVKASMQPGYSNWRNFATELDNISLRGGVDKGFPSIMFHTSDWIIDNTSRGNVREITEDFQGGVVVRTKSLDELTRKRDKFAVLEDPEVFESVRMFEMGFRTHRIPTLKKETIKKKDVLEEMEEGDVIILVPNRDGIDCYDIGIVTFKAGEPYLIHLSPEKHLVVEEDESLIKYMPLMTKHFQGYRIIKVRE